MTAAARRRSAGPARMGWRQRARRAWRRWAGTGPGRWAAVGIAFAGFALLALLAIALIASIGAGRPDSSAHDRAAIAEYAAAVDPLVKEGGRIVVDGIKPAITDLRTGRMTPADFQASAKSWRAQMERVREQVSALPHPSVLNEAAALYDLALRQYGDAIDAFVAASRQSPLDTAITAAAPVAEEADRTYDRADALVQSALSSAGLPTHPTFPSGS